MVVGIVFVVNFFGKSKDGFLRVNIEGLTRDPAIKGELSEIKKILRKETGKNEVEDVYFTSFVMH